LFEPGFLSATGMGEGRIVHSVPKLVWDIPKIEEVRNFGRELKISWGIPPFKSPHNSEKYFYFSIEISAVFPIETLPINYHRGFVVVKELDDVCVDGVKYVGIV